MTTPASRRNGKLASCEPCRKAKIRCDHERPICGRCNDRGITDKCFYHPAPLTKPRGTRNPPRSRPASVSIAPINNSGLQRAERAVYVAGTGNNESIHYALRAGNESDVRHSQFQNVDVNLRRQVNEVLDVFEPLQYLEDIDDLVQSYTSTAEVSLVPAPVLRYATSTLFETSRRFSLRDAEPDRDRSHSFATTVLQNTSVAAVVHSSELDYRAFVDTFTGDVLRLEMLGLIYTVAARSLVYRLYRHERYNDQLLFRLFKAAQACLDLARELAPGMNDVLIWLSLELFRLYTNAQGDTHSNVWRAMGDTTSDIYMMEIHREAKVAADTPFWLAECRRKNWAVVFHWDKALATHFQRPPRISSRYSDCELPLDLKDDELLGSTDILTEARSRLTSDGWNPEGAYCSTTWYRLRYMADVLREEQIEYKDRELTNTVGEKLKLLAARSHAQWASLPGCLQYHHGMWSSGRKSSTCLMLAIVYLLHLHIDMQVYAVLLRTDPGYGDTMLRIANQIVGTVVRMGQIQDRHVFLQADNAYVILSYGLPAAAILIPALSDNKSLPDDISRSKLIRDLSVFISYLESICAEGEANYTVCMQAAHVFSRALDDVLEPKDASQVPKTPALATITIPTPLPSGPSTAHEAADHGGVPRLDFSDGLDAFDLDSWMQSVDWTSVGGEFTF